MTITPRTNTSVISPLIGLVSLLGAFLIGMQSADAKELVYAYDFESGTFDGLGHNNIGNGNLPSITSSFTRSGKYAMKSYVNRLTSGYSYRTEVAPARSGSSVKYTYGQHYWAGFSILLPNNYKESEVWELLAQWHATQDKHLGESSHPPPLALEVGRGSWRVVSRSDGKAKTPARQVETLMHKKYWNINPVAEDKGKWVDWVFHIKFSWKSDGILQVWKNKKLVVDHRGPNAFNDRTPPYFKMGLYLNWFDRQCCTGGPVEKTVFHDELRVMRGPDVKYEDVAPPTNKQSKTAPSPPSPPKVFTN